jgi:hypothetical protein
MVPLLAAGAPVGASALTDLTGVRQESHLVWARAGSDEALFDSINMCIFNILYVVLEDAWL